MQDTTPNLKPQRYEFRSRYLSVDLSEIKNSLQRMVSDSGLYFSKPLDDASFEVIGPEGVLRETVPISDIAKVFNLIQETTGQVRLHLSIEERTPHRGFKLPPSEYAEFVVDFSRRTISSNVSILGLERAEQIGKILTEGIVLVSIELSPQHRYLEPLVENFLTDHPDNEKNVFLIMRFKEEAPFPDIVDAVRSTCAAKGLHVIRSDDKEYTDDLLDNVLTHMYCCDYAIAIFDEVNYREFNPNVALEVGFYLAKGKRVLILKDQAIRSMPADIVGKSYKSFNTYDAKSTIPPQINKWLQDYGIGEKGKAV